MDASPWKSFFVGTDTIEGNRHARGGIRGFQPFPTMPLEFDRLHIQRLLTP
jgi:hypothetical protein